MAIERDTAGTGRILLGEGVDGLAAGMEVLY